MYIKKWLDSFNFSHDELFFLTHISNTVNNNKILYPSNDLQEKFYTIFPNKQHINTHNVMFYDGATTVIDWLFQTYVDEETLIITTSSEHGSVCNNLKKFKNVEYLFQSNNISFDFDLKKIKKFKRVFLYTISLSMGDSLNMGTDTIQYIIQKIKMLGVELITVFDCVQEMFLVDRDYSQYDYVIGTAHAIIHNIDFGILLYKKDKFVLNGFFSVEDIYNYIKAIKIIQKNMNNLLLFNYMMYQYFSKYIQKDKNLNVINNYFPTFFILTDKLNRLFGIQEIDENSTKPTISTVCFRATDFVCEPDIAFNKINKVDYVLST